MTRRGGVHHDGRIAGVLHPCSNLQEGHHLVQARHGEVQKLSDIGLIQKRSAESHRSKMRHRPCFEPRKAVLWVDLADHEVLGRGRTAKTIGK